MGITSSLTPAPPHPSDFLRWLLDNNYGGWVRILTTDGWTKRGIVSAYDDVRLMLAFGPYSDGQSIKFWDIRGVKVLMDKEPPTGWLGSDSPSRRTTPG